MGHATRRRTGAYLARATVRDLASRSRAAVTHHGIRCRVLLAELSARSFGESFQRVTVARLRGHVPGALAAD